MVLTYDAYNETLEKEHNKDSEVKLLKEKYENDMKAMRDELKQEMRSQISQLIIKLKPEIIQQGLS
jgi:flagellar biosynthesis/type III secretory pathway protein FliH